MHEILTLQLGRQSNFVATHFWNAQESYFTYGQDTPSPVDHDVHWRAGLGADGTETYLPRTVVYDRKGGLGSLRRVNALYEAPPSQADAAAAALWPGRAVVHRAEPIAPSAYTQSLDSGLPPAAPLTPAAVRYWSDFSRVYYHPRSLVEVGDEPETSTSSDAAAAAGTGAGGAGGPAREPSWAEGEALFAGLDREHDLLDRDLRPFAEEADQMQGIQVLATVDDAWGGFAARYLERLRDEYGKATIWLWALQEPAGRLPREKRAVRLANKARSLAAAHDQASLVIPLAVPAAPAARRQLQPGFDPAVPWHAAALLATALETATLPTRLRFGPAAGSSSSSSSSAAASSSGDSMAYLTALLNATGRQTVANLQMRVVTPWTPDQRTATTAAASTNAEDHDASLALHLPLDFAPQDDPSAASVSYGRRQQIQQQQQQHGKKTRLFGQAVVTRAAPRDDDDGADDDDDDDDDTATDRRDMARRRLALKPVSQRYKVALGFPLLDSFPYIYDGTDRATAAIPVTTALATDSAVAARLQALRAAVGTGMGRSGLAGSGGALAVEEDREALANDLAVLADAYHDGWSSGSDDGDDDA